jgi:hypothetical protein
VCGQRTRAMAPAGVDAPVQYGPRICAIVVSDVPHFSGAIWVPTRLVGSGLGMGLAFGGGWELVEE